MVRLDELLGSSPGIAVVRQNIARILQRPSQGRRLPPVLIQGETGTGKTLLARAMHLASARREGPFVPVNCANLPDSLLEAQLFGHERGAFTDARQARPGLFQSANGGTIFLDEVALMSETVQGKLLTAIEEKTVRRLGSTRSEAVDVWVVAASSVDLAEATRDHTFREDLYHRLAVVTVSLPPLRERGDDIPLLAEHFLARACRDYGLGPKRLDERARGALRAYAWPGNVRQLANAMERVALFADTDVVTEAMLDFAGPAPTATRAPGLKEELGEHERDRLLEALRQTGWNLSRAAERLGLPRNTLRYRMKKFDLRAEPGAGPADATVTPAPRTAAEPSAPPGGMRWETRRLTLLRLALVSPTADQPLAATVIDVLGDKIEAFGGHVEDRGASDIVAAFGIEPIEDAPRRAVHTAQSVLKAVERARAEGEAVAVKMAIHVGRFRVGVGAGLAPRIDLESKREAWAVLDALLAAGETDAVVTSAEAAPFLERDFDVVAHANGPGRPGYGTVAAGCAPRAVERRAAFVGRRENLDVLDRQLETAMRGRGQAIGIIGDAGIGKSRLLAEFRRRLARRDVAYLEGPCFSYASAVPYLPVLALLRQCCGVVESDTAAAVAAAVRRRLGTLGVSGEESVLLLLQLFGLREAGEQLAVLTPDAIRLRTVETVREVLVAASRERPLVIAVEDLHWIDKASEDVLAAVAGDLPGAPILLISTYRSGYRPPWMDRSFASQMALPPLSSEESVTMLQSLLRGPIPERVARLIVDKAEGNPFFLEEMGRAFDGDDVERPPRVPDTIEQVLLARIERLPEAPRSVLQSAAVLGRQFAPGLLHAVWRGEGSLETHVRLLTGLELFYERRDAHAAPAFVFKHALTQEVAYASLPPARRRELHAAAGRALEVLFADRLEEAYDSLAHHYARTDDAAKAATYLSRFAEKAARADAHAEAVKAWREAFAHVDRLPPDIRDRRRMEIVLRLPLSLLPLGRIEEITSLLLGERECLERLADPALAARYHFLLARAYMLGGHDRVADHARRAIAEAERCGDEATMGAAYGVLALACALSGQGAQGVGCGQRAVVLLEKTGEPWSLSYACWALGLCYSQVAAFPEALAAETRALAIAETIGDRTLEAQATWARGITQAAMGESEAGVASCERAVERTRDALNRAIATGFLGFAYLQQGDAARAMAALERAIPPLRQFGLAAFEGWFTAFQADACRLAGNLGRAETLAVTALAIAEKASFGVAVGWAQQVLGRIAGARGDLVAAATRLDEALATFGPIQSRYETGRAHMDLAEVWWARHAHDAARRHLEHARAIFREIALPRYCERVDRLAASFDLWLGDDR